MRSTFLALLLIGSAVLASRPARATQIEQLTFEQIVAESDVVVIARVGGMRSRWLEDRIVTDVELVVERSAKGSRPGARITLLRIGGAIGELGMFVDGEPRFEVGERVLVFADDMSGSLRAVGNDQGVFHERRTAPSATPGVTSSTLVHGSPPSVPTSSSLDAILERAASLIQASE